MRDYVDSARNVGSFREVVENQYYVRERVLAGYLMANGKFDWGSVVGGVRVEKVSNRGRAFATIPGATGQIEAKSSSTLAFPSLHVNGAVFASPKSRLSP